MGSATIRTMLSVYFAVKWSHETDLNCLKLQFRYSFENHLIMTDWAATVHRTSLFFEAIEWLPFMLWCARTSLLESVTGCCCFRVEHLRNHWRLAVNWQGHADWLLLRWVWSQHEFIYLPDTNVWNVKEQYSVFPQKHAVFRLIDCLCFCVIKELNTSLILQYRSTVQCHWWSFILDRCMFESTC